jgi:phage gp36-like protein
MRVYTSRVPDCHPDRKHCALGLCRPCWSKQYQTNNNFKHSRQWQEKNKERFLQNCREYRKANQHKYIANRLGVPVDQVKHVLERTACDICNVTGKLVVDHHHKTQTVRGRLCQGCNKAIGFLGDRPEVALGVYHYLLNHEESVNAELVDGPSKTDPA